jgi:Polyketide cyclase / dehydrase and lipid transport
MSDGAWVEFDLAIRSQIDIAAPAPIVWSALSNLRAWKTSVVSVERLAGEADCEGETLRIGQRPMDVTVHTIMRSVRVQKPHWKIQTLQTEDGRATDGYVLYTLEPFGSGTRICCQVIAQCRVPDPGTMPQPAFARHVNEATRAKLDADHMILKRLLEGRAD